MDPVDECLDKIIDLFYKIALLTIVGVGEVVE